MADMLVKLYELPDSGELCKALESKGIRIVRALAPDRLAIVDWVKKHSGPFAAGEAEACFSSRRPTIYVAVKDSAILGYACYEATAPDFFGPTRVLDEYQGQGIGKALLIKSLEGLRELGYAYAVIGSVGPVEFYAKCCNAIIIPDSKPGIYKDFLKIRF
ncbi:MAG: GNAT family N-acetyltransferase [Sphaerochaetaceae bacterium]|jgi:GNAT superfamily N-acetyltransferase|nr:GNAT family N-acetyltransferase [Sphaerochaetaceae bacterium]